MRRESCVLLLRQLAGLGDLAGRRLALATRPVLLVEGELTRDGALVEPALAQGGVIRGEAFRSRLGGARCLVLRPRARQLKLVLLLRDPREAGHFALRRVGAVGNRVFIGALADSEGFRLRVVHWRCGRRGLVWCELLRIVRVLDWDARRGGDSTRRLLTRREVHRGAAG